MRYGLSETVIASLKLAQGIFVEPVA